ncbi:MAG: three-Cys-motif partner protein TcmP [Chloroflexi bacterium]|nr:three-Cys-motif partner protein TcmP [Chloroflexota bacterium]
MIELTCQLRGNALTHAYLLPEDDGLPMRESQDYAKDKLRILEGYISRFTTSMRNKQWSALGYIDLLSGPGKNRFQPSGDILLGSPLIALTTRYPFTYYHFVEMGNQEHNALEQRIASSEHVERVKVIYGDCNVIVNSMVAEIEARDRQFLAEHKWSSLNLAFLDLEGLELEWATVEKLGRVRKMDLIINFSTSGFTRNAAQMLESENTARFGQILW